MLCVVRCTRVRFSTHIHIGKCTNLTAKDEGENKYQERTRANQHIFFVLENTLYMNLRLSSCALASIHQF